MENCIKKSLNIINNLCSRSGEYSSYNFSVDNIYIGFSILNEIGEIFDNLPYLGHKIVVISDDNTYVVAARRICKILDVKNIQSVVLSADTKPTMDMVHKLRKSIRDADSVIGVGSGTINDLCKCICALEDKIYILFATAPSMNGYCTANASIIVDGYKQSIIGVLPKVIVCDLDILSKVPLRLIQSGIGDSLCRSTCQADWLMSHLLFSTTYNARPFEWIQELEFILWDNIKGVIQGDIELIQVLMLIQILSGIGMYICKGSYPASQGEHLIAHLLEPKYPYHYHGEQIAVTTIFMSELQEYLLNQDQIMIYPNHIDETYLNKYFGYRLGQKYFAEIQGKLLSDIQAKYIQNNLIAKWDTVKNTIKVNYVNSARLKKILYDAKMANNYKIIGWDYQKYTDAILYSAFIRNRITFLDLARYSRVLEDFVRQVL
ncbi:MAG: iron-containing alcohol dehydrogenase [Rickettsiales endosymbiont of Dermacentor nuttalli]